MIQAIQNILLGLPEDIYAAVLIVMKCSGKSGYVEAIECLLSLFLKVDEMISRETKFSEKVASNLMFLNNLQPEWSRHVTIVHQTKDLHTADYTQLYDFLKYNQKEVDDLRAERLAKTHDPLALMVNSNNPYNYPVFHLDQPSPSTYMQQPLPNYNNYNPQPSFNQNYMQQPMLNPEDITDPTTTMNMALIAQPGMNMGQDRQMHLVRGNDGNQFRQYAGQNVGNPNGYNAVQSVRNQNPNGNGNVVAARAEGNTNGNNGNQIRCYNYRGLGHLARNYTVRPRRRDAAYLQTQLLIAQKEEVGIQLQAEEFDLMATAANLDEIESAEVHHYDSFYNNDIFNMFTQEEQYTELLEPILEPHQVQQNDSNVISEVSSVEQHRGTEKSTVSSLLEEKKKLKSDFKTRQDELLDKQIQLENKINELDNILVKIENGFGLSKSFYLKQAQQKQQSLYNGKVLLEKHDPPAVYDSKETLQLAQESRLKMKQLNKEIKPANYAKINHLSGVFVSQTAKSHEELYFSNTSKTANVSKPISIPNEEFSDDTIPSVAQKFLNEENEYAKLWNDWYKKCKECKYDKISYDKAYNDMQQKIKQLQAQLGDQKGKSKDTPCVPNTLDPLSQKIEIENVELEFQVSEQKDTTKGTSVNTQFCKQSILGKPPSSSRSKLYVVTHFPKSKGLPKIDETHALINPFEPSREEKSVLNKVRANVRTNPITVSQHHVITEKGVNSNLNGLSSIGVDNTAKNQRPQSRSNTKNDRVLSTFKSSCIKNKEVEVEEHPRNLLLSKNKKHMLSECFGDLQWGNILITMVYFVEGLGHNLFSVGQFCDCTTNLYTINLHEMASASPICLMARVTSTKSWLWHQRLCHLNFETINDLARNDLVTGLPKFKYHKEHICPSCEQGKIKRASHPPKPVLNSKQRLHLLHMDLCGLMRVESINGKRYVRVIVDDYSRYTWVYFLRLKDEAPEVIKTFLKKIQVLLQAPVIIVRTDNVTEFKNQVLKEYFDTIATACYTQNRSIIHRRFDKTPYELINGRKPYISFLHVFGALCYPKNDCEDIGKLGAKAMYDDYIGGQPSSAPRTTLAAQAPHVLQTPTTSTTIADTAPTPTNSSSQATNFPNTS
ncbi:retrovirus-related pol polyprotein from transposon TNT 1-94 [Tanacetum coccineum]